MINKIIIEDRDIPTELCLIMNKYGSDKGFRLHDYTQLYHRWFRDTRRYILNIFELGLGTNNPNLPSSMGIYGKPGASLRGWREYFPISNIYGADIDRDILFSEDRIQTFYVDQLDEVKIQSMWKENLDDLLFDIIIDDGLHTLDANICFLKNSIHKLSSNGVYVIEDVIIKNLSDYRIALDGLNLNYEVFIIDNSFGQFELNDGCLILIKNQKST